MIRVSTRCPRITLGGSRWIDRLIHKCAPRPFGGRWRRNHRWVETWEQLLRRQHGLFTLAQGKAHGVPRSVSRERERDGLYRTVAPRTMYVAGAVGLSDEALLWRAILTCRAAVVSHTTAARLWGLRLRDDGRLHVTVPRQHWRRRTGIEMHTATRMAAADCVVRRLLPATSLARTLVDAFGILEGADERATLVADAFRDRRLHMTDISACVMRMDVVPRRAELFAVLELAAGGSQSAGEIRLLAILRRWGLPEPARQHTLRLPSATREIDCALAAYQIALEYDGRHHLDDVQRHHDQLRDEELRRVQWLTIRISGRRLRDEARLVRDIWANIVEQAERLGVELPPRPKRAA